MPKFKVGVLGATGMVGQRFVSLLDGHPWFRVVAVAASPRSAGKKYGTVVKARWAVPGKKVPAAVKNLVVLNVNEIEKIKGQVDFVFSALDMPKDKIRDLEDAYAKADVPVVSNNSAHRWTPDVPMIMPEVNPEHIELIKTQRKKRGWKKGLIAVKPNCSLQSYLLAVHALRKFKPTKLIITTMQAISGAGKTFDTFPEIIDNVIPNIGGEEEKSEREPMKILGKLKNGRIIEEKKLKISAHCNRVAATDGHMATVSIEFAKKPTEKQILAAWKSFQGVPQKLNLPSAPKPPLIYLKDDFRPQTRLDRDAGKGMAATIGRLRKCLVLDYRFVCLSHNTVRGAAGGAILVAELLAKKGYLK
ncbi:MAG: aspartate-semialdehyde dehydrogenase [Patescibacteria group bacterium]